MSAAPTFERPRQSSGRRATATDSVPVLTPGNAVSTPAGVAIGGESSRPLPRGPRSGGATAVPGIRGGLIGGNSERHVEVNGERAWTKWIDWPSMDERK